MRSTFNRIKELTSLYYKLLVILALLAVLMLVMIYLLFTKYYNQQSEKPPVIKKSVESLLVLEAAPVGVIESLDNLYPVYIEFNQDVSKSLDYLFIDIKPYIKYRKFVLSSNPNRLWIEPDNKDPTSGDIIGWENNLVYKVTVLKGSRTIQGHLISEDYSFSFAVNQDVQAVVD